MCNWDRQFQHLLQIAHLIIRNVVFFWGVAGRRLVFPSSILLGGPLVMEEDT